MKKFLKISVCLFVVVLLAGCGANSNNNTNEKSKNTNNQSVENVSESKIAEFVEQAKGEIEALSNDILDAKLIARGKSVVYQYTYKTVYSDEQAAAMKTSLDDAINKQESVFTNLLSQIRSTVAADAESVVVEYYNGDNTLITSIEFK